MSSWAKIDAEEKSENHSKTKPKAEINLGILQYRNRKGCKSNNVMIFLIFLRLTLISTYYILKLLYRFYKFCKIYWQDDFINPSKKWPFSGRTPSC